MIHPLRRLGSHTSTPQINKDNIQNWSKLTSRVSDLFGQLMIATHLPQSTSPDSMADYYQQFSKIRQDIADLQPPEKKVPLETPIPHTPHELGTACIELANQILSFFANCTVKSKRYGSSFEREWGNLRISLENAKEWVPTLKPKPQALRRPAAPVPPMPSIPEYSDLQALKPSEIIDLALTLTPPQSLESLEGNNDFNCKLNIIEQEMNEHTESEAKQQELRERLQGLLQTLNQWSSPDSPLPLSPEFIEYAIKRIRILQQRTFMTKKDFESLFKHYLKALLVTQIATGYKDTSDLQRKTRLLFHYHYISEKTFNRFQTCLGASLPQQLIYLSPLFLRQGISFNPSMIEKLQGIFKDHRLLLSQERYGLEWMRRKLIHCAKKVDTNHLFALRHFLHHSALLLDALPLEQKQEKTWRQWALIILTFGIYLTCLPKTSYQQILWDRNRLMRDSERLTVKIRAQQPQQPLTATS